MLFQTALMKERLGNSSVLTTLDLSGNPCTSSFTVLETFMTGIMENPPDKKGFIKELGISVPCYRREDIEVIFAESTFMKVCIQKSKFISSCFRLVNLHMKFSLLINCVSWFESRQNSLAKIYIYFFIILTIYNNLVT